jgi:hypothetical protein
VALARASHKALKEAPAFPTKRWRIVTNHTCPRFVESRRRELEHYVRSISRIPLIACHPKFLRFIGLQCPRHFSVKVRCCVCVRAR